MTDAPVMEMRQLDADKPCELIEGLIEANRALALKVDGLERAVATLKRPIVPTVWDMSKGTSVNPVPLPVWRGPFNGHLPDGQAATGGHSN